MEWLIGLDYFLAISFCVSQFLCFLIQVPFPAFCWVDQRFFWLFFGGFFWPSFCSLKQCSQQGHCYHLERAVLWDVTLFTSHCRTFSIVGPGCEITVDPCQSLTTQNVPFLLFPVENHLLSVQVLHLCFLLITYILKMYLSYIGLSAYNGVSYCPPEQRNNFLCFNCFHI